METLQVRFQLSDDQIRVLADDAVRFGWLRENERKAWTKAEYREAARYAIEHHALLAIESKA